MANADPDRAAANDTHDNQLLAMMLGVAGTQLIGLAAELNIPDLLNDGARSIETIAEATGTRKAALLQAMRALAALGIFAEPQPNHFAITPLGELLRTDVPNSLRGYAIMLASGMMLRGWANLPHALRTSQGALDDALGMETYDYLQQHKPEAAVFDAAMSSISGQESTALQNAYDFSQFRTLVDVGGSRGLVLLGLLDAHPALHGVLFDLPNVVEGARALLGEHVASGRCQIAGGDFCADMLPGGDAYLLKRVLVVLDDDRSDQVLRNCRKAITQGGRLLVAEPDPSSLYGRLYDVFMLMAHGTRLRSEAEMEELLANSGSNCGVRSAHARRCVCSKASRIRVSSSPGRFKPSCRAKARHPGLSGREQPKQRSLNSRAAVHPGATPGDRRNVRRANLVKTAAEFQHSSNQR